MSRVAVVAAVLVAAAAGAGCGSSKPSVERLSAARNFTGGRDAAGALATISTRLLDEQKTCAARHGAGDVRCETRGVVIAWAQQSAVDVARCGRAGALDARRTLLGLLAQRDAADAGRLRAAPPLPPTPSCR